MPSSRAVAGAAFASVALLLPLSLLVTGAAGAADPTPAPPTDASAALRAEYRLKAQELDRLRVYNTHLAALVEDQRDKLAGVDAERERARRVGQEIVPLMTRMLDNLERFVAADLPIMPEQRRARLAALRAMMSDAGIANAEKYRRIVAAYQAEMDIGRKPGTYRGDLERDGTTQIVNFFHLGRVLLAWQSEDRSVTAFWNPAADPPGWQDLPDEYRSHIDTAMRVADRQAAPVLLRLPVPAPVARP